MLDVRVNSLLVISTIKNIQLPRTSNVQHEHPTSNEYSTFQYSIPTFTIFIVIMDIVVMILMVFAGLFLAGMIILRSPKRNKKNSEKPLPDLYRQILQEYVAFYNHLDLPKRLEFENRVQAFLSKVRITGINTTVDDMDRVL